MFPCTTGIDAPANVDASSISVMKLYIATVIGRLLTALACDGPWQKLLQSSKFGEKLLTEVPF